MKTGAKIFIGIPFYKSFVGQVVDSYDNGVDPKGQNQYVKQFCGDSFLARCFNTLWTIALNDRGKRQLSHFAMIHADVRPRGYWLDTMVDEMRKSGADLLSVVLPIKSEHGLTSTAIRNQDTGDIRRLTMHELYPTYSSGAEKSRSSGVGLPLTFDGNIVAKVLGLKGRWDLLPSTGLWICDFTSSWVEKVYFEVRDRILRRENGEFYVECAPDDWLFAFKLHKMGLRLMSTKAVTCGHWGEIEFRNDVAWGTLEEDNRVNSFSWLGKDDL